MEKKDPALRYLPLSQQYTPTSRWPWHGSRAEGACWRAGTARTQLGPRRACRSLRHANSCVLVPALDARTKILAQLVRHSPQLAQASGFRVEIYKLIAPQVAGRGGWGATVHHRCADCCVTASAERDLNAKE
eukprot:366256-Chlamydomonas_euryale.AAC.26